jgi:hypothetical protein
VPGVVDDWRSRLHRSDAGQRSESCRSDPSRPARHRHGSGQAAAIHHRLDGGVVRSDGKVANDALRFNTFTGQANDANSRDGEPTKWVIISAPIFSSPEGSLFYPPIIADPNSAGAGSIFQGSFSVWRTQDWGGDQAYLEANCPEFTTFAGQAGRGNFVRIGPPNATDLTDPTPGTQMVGDLSAEGVDRSTLLLPTVNSVDQNALVVAVAAANPKTIVVLKNGGPVLLPWLNQVPAVLEAWYPNQEDGNVVARLLFGLVNPSGKLAITFPTGEREATTSTVSQWPGITVNGILTATYSEGLQMGYRWYDANGVKPQFPFGFGLSYTTFSISNLTRKYQMARSR